ncbi:GntR family transcriptional regulator [Caulobacter segnis]
MTVTPLTRRLADQIQDLVRDGAFPAGDQLTERGLAERLRVSRSPVRTALRLLEAEGVVRPAARGGYVAIEGEAAASVRPGEDDDADGALYGRLINDRLDERLPERLTENELVRRYGLTRGQLTRLLRRAVAEGLMERLPGHGWAFLPALTSLADYGDSYRFRQTIEPAAILEPSFVLDIPALEQRRRQQIALIDGEIHTASDARIFELNSGLHETIITCSGNSFFIDALVRLNRLRRLMEHRQRLDRADAVERCREHVAILDLLLEGRRPEAAALMRRHLSSVGAAKVRPKTSA